MTDLVKYAGAIARELFGGKADAGLSDATHLRYGAISINLTNAKYFDADADEGGDLPSLVAYMKGFENGEADKWIAEVASRADEERKRLSAEAIDRDLPLDTSPGRDLDTERLLIGALILQPSEIGHVIEELEPSDFAEPVHRDVYNTILESHNREEMITLPGVVNTLGGDDGQEVVEGFTITQYLVRLAADAPTGVEFLTQAREMGKTIHLKAEERLRSIDDYEKEVERDIAAQKARFKLRAFNDVIMTNAPVYRLRGILPRTGLAVVWGPPKCGKSFWLYDVCMHIALGWEYRGRKVDQGNVVYLVLEGESGYAARVQAFRQRFIGGAPTTIPLYDIVTRIDLTKDHVQLIKDVKAQLGDQPLAVMAIDTLNRSLHGSENSDEDMGKYIKACDAIREAFGCLIVLVHHCGVAGERPRGHTSLTGACDAQIAVRKDSSDNVVVKVEHMKDGKSGEELINRLEWVQVAAEWDGEPIGSCVVVDQSGQGASAGFKAKPHEMTFMRCLLECLDEHGVPPSSVHGLILPKSIDKVVDFKFMREKFWQSSTQLQVDEDEKKHDARIRQDLSRAGKWLSMGGVIGVYKPTKSAQYIWWTGRPVAGLKTRAQATEDAKTTADEAKAPLPADAGDIDG